MRQGRLKSKNQTDCSNFVVRKINFVPGDGCSLKIDGGKEIFEIGVRSEFHCPTVESLWLEFTFTSVHTKAPSMSGYQGGSPFGIEFASDYRLVMKKKEDRTIVGIFATPASST